MGLLSFFRREPAPSASGESAAPRKRGAKAAQAEQAEQVQLLRQRAKHRLIGAAVLVGIGIVAFPLVFETQPRPVPMDLPIVIPSQDSPAGALAPTARPPQLPASLPEAAQAQARVTEPVPPPAVVEEPAEEPAQPAPAPVAAKPERQATASTAKPAEGAARYVVQVGAFADKKSAQDARERLERKGLKTYAQVAQTKEGERIRVRLGPFTAKADADKAAAMAQSVGLAGKVLTL
jgi:DedD protein